MKNVAAILLILLAGLAVADTAGRFVYTANSFSGGLNVATDSINMAPSQGIMTKNLMLDLQGALHKRYGIWSWNDTLIANQQVRDFQYVDDKNGAKRCYVACGNYVYEESTWTDINSSWGDKILGYGRGKIDSATNNGQKYVYGDTTSWVLVAAPNDRIVIQGSTYTIDSVLADTLLHVTTNLAVTGDTFSTYEIRKYIVGEPQLSSWNGNLYVADSKAVSWLYDGKQAQLLGIVDSGTVTFSPESVLVVTPYSTGYISTRLNSTTFTLFSPGDINAKFEDSSSVFAAGNMFHLSFTFPDGPTRTFSAQIVAVSGTQVSFQFPLRGNMFLPVAIPDDYLNPLNYIHVPDTTGQYPQWGWSVTGRNSGPLTRLNYFADSTKNFALIDYTGFAVINGKDAKKWAPIISNAEAGGQISFDSTSGVTFADSDRYYVVWQIPSMKYTRVLFGYHGVGELRDSSQTDLIYWGQILFHRNRLYAFGKQIISYKIQGFGPSPEPEQGDTVNTNRIWFSDIAEPSMIRGNYNFDVTGTTSRTSLFSSEGIKSLQVLRDDIHAVTGSSIYRISGEPDVSQVGYGLWVTQVAKGVGSKGPKSVTVSYDDKMYLMNADGIWEYEAGYPQKISLNVDPLIKRYQDSEMVAGYTGDYVLFSFPDSGKTLVYYKPLGQFCGPWDVGMNFVNIQPVATDSGYFLFGNPEVPGYIERYPAPASKFFDRFAPAETTGIYFEYRSGWFGPQMEYQNRAEEVYVQVSKGRDAIAFNLFYDLANYDSLWTKSLGAAVQKRIWRFRVSPQVVGDYLAYSVGTAASMQHPDSTGDFILSEVSIKCGLGSTPKD